MGFVSRVYDHATDKRVALKRLLKGARSQHVALFQREFYTLASLHHPHIIEVYDYGVDVVRNDQVQLHVLLEAPRLAGTKAKADSWQLTSMRPYQRRCWRRSKVRMSSSEATARHSRVALVGDRAEALE
jgi:serine/threonine protein kinase